VLEWNVYGLIYVEQKIEELAVILVSEDEDGGRASLLILFLKPLHRLSSLVFFSV
jgi:hypothetical protein